MSDEKEEVDIEHAALGFALEYAEYRAEYGTSSPLNCGQILMVARAFADFLAGEEEDKPPCV